MAVAAGTRLGTYEVIEPLGCGGMGEVYRARDPRLDRDVALKVLPPLFADELDRVARFKREAHVLAHLGHANIGAIYGIEEADGLHFLILELVPGDTLANRLDTGTVDIREALGIATQVAAALEAAHDKGIIHRDVKPANIKITPDGSVKVLDFGLAKTTGDLRTAVSDEPTVSLDTTKPGFTVGTIRYMSPEQVRGRTVDRRTDIWAFGCVLFETLTGRQAFAGTTSSDTIVGILTAEPDYAALPADVPVEVRRLLRRCLEKDIDRRLQHIADARVELQDLVDGRIEPADFMAARRERAGGRGWIAVASLLAGAVVGIAGPSFWTRTASSPLPIARLRVALPAGERLVRLDNPAIALSPDGRQLVFVGEQKGEAQLFVRSLDRQSASPMAGTENPLDPFFSPDGQWVAFFSGGKLRKVPVGGGTVVTLCDAPQPRGGSWGDDGTIVFAPRGAAGLFRVSASGGTPQPITVLRGGGETSHRWPQVLPGGDTIVYTSGRAGSFDTAEIIAHRVSDGSRRVVATNATFGRYVPTGHLVFVHESTVMAAPFDAGRLELTGEPAPILEGVLDMVNGATHFSFSNTGWLAYLAWPASEPARHMIWVDRRGVVETALQGPRGFMHPRLSPDGRMAAVMIEPPFSSEGARSDLWTYDFGRSTLTRLTFDARSAWPVWTPDGTRLAFAARRGGPPNIYIVHADGTAETERLTTSANAQTPYSWTPDGRTLAYVEVAPDTGSDDIFTLTLGDPVRTAAVTTTPFREGAPAFSPDGRWLAYVSNETGRREVYIRSYPTRGARVQVSSAGGYAPAWSGDGRELFFQAGPRLMVASVAAAQAGVDVGRPRLVFERRVAESHTYIGNYDVSRNGQRFLMVDGEDDWNRAPDLNLIVNWFDDLTRRLPARGADRQANGR